MGAQEFRHIHNLAEEVDVDLKRAARRKIREDTLGVTSWWQLREQNAEQRGVPKKRFTQHRGGGSWGRFSKYASKHAEFVAVIRIT